MNHTGFDRRLGAMRRSMVERVGDDAFDTTIFMFLFTFRHWTGKPDAAFLALFRILADPQSSVITYSDHVCHPPK